MKKTRIGKNEKAKDKVQVKQPSLCIRRKDTNVNMLHKVQNFVKIMSKYLLPSIGSLVSISDILYALYIISYGLFFTRVYTVNLGTLSTLKKLIVLAKIW